MPLVVLVVSVGLEGNSLRTAVRESNPSRGSRSSPQFIRSAKAPELPGHPPRGDLAALIGLVFAMLGVGMTIFLTGNGRWDAAARAHGLLLVTVAVVLAVEMKSLLLGEAASVEHMPKRIEDAICSPPPPTSVDRLISTCAPSMSSPELHPGQRRSP